MRTFGNSYKNLDDMDRMLSNFGQIQKFLNKYCAVPNLKNISFLKIARKFGKIKR